MGPEHRRGCPRGMTSGKRSLRRNYPHTGCCSPCRGNRESSVSIRWHLAPCCYCRRMRKLGCPERHNRLIRMDAICINEFRRKGSIPHHSRCFSERRLHLSFGGKARDKTTSGLGTIGLQEVKSVIELKPISQELQTFCTLANGFGINRLGSCQSGHGG